MAEEIQSYDEMLIEACAAGMKYSGLITNGLVATAFSGLCVYFSFNGGILIDGFGWLAGIAAVNTLDSVASMVVPKTSKDQSLRALGHLYRFSPALLTIASVLLLQKPETLKPIFIAASIKASINGLWALCERFGRATESVAVLEMV